MFFTCADPDERMGTPLFDGPADVEDMEATLVANLSANTIWKQNNYFITSLERAANIMVQISDAQPGYLGTLGCREV
jgi:hypothetical protein